MGSSLPGSSPAQPGSEGEGTGPIPEARPSNSTFRRVACVGDRRALECWSQAHRVNMLTSTQAIVVLPRPQAPSREFMPNGPSLPDRSDASCAARHTQRRTPRGSQYRCASPLPFTSSTTGRLGKPRSFTPRSSRTRPSTTSSDSPTRLRVRPSSSPFTSAISPSWRSPRAPCSASTQRSPSW